MAFQMLTRARSSFDSARIGRPQGNGLWALCLLRMRVENFSGVLLGPSHDSRHNGDQSSPEVGERVIDRDRSSREHLSANQAVFLQRAQGLGEHLLRDTLHGSSQFPETVGTLLEQGHDQCGPAITDPVKDEARGTAGI